MHNNKSGAERVCNYPLLHHKYIKVYLPFCASEYYYHVMNNMNDIILYYVDRNKFCEEVASVT